MSSFVIVFAGTKTKLKITSACMRSRPRVTVRMRMRMDHPPRSRKQVEEKFGRYFGRGKNLYYHLAKWKCCVRIGWKSTLPKFEISINSEIRIKFQKFGFPKNQKPSPQNLKLSCDFEFLGQTFYLEKLKIVFSHSFRISIRDLKIWNRRPRFPLNLFSRAQIRIFLQIPKSWFWIN